MNLGRILLRDPFGMNLPAYIYQTAFCRNQSSPSAHNTYDCYYEPISSCTIEDVCPGFYNKTIPEQRKCTDAMVTYNAWNDVSVRDILSQNFSDPVLHLPVIKLPNFINTPRFDYPLKYKDLLDCSHALEVARRNRNLNFPLKLSPPAGLWTSVGTAFLIRPNNLTLMELDRLRNLPSAVRRIPSHSNATVRECTVGMYVRHGDKYIEMRLVPIEAYLSAASALVQAHLGIDRLNSSQGQSKSMFFGTETPNLLAVAANWSRDNEWDFTYTDLFDRSKVPSAMISNSPKNDEAEYISMILNLDLHLRCQSWISTMRSNWCRIQDELRSTIARKADLINVALN